MATKRKKRAVAKRSTGKRGRTRSSAKTDGSTEVALLRSIESLKLRCAGASYWDIGQALGVSKKQAWDDVQGLLELTLDETKPETDKLRALENERLDLVLQKVLPNIVNAQADKVTGMVKMTEDLKASIFSFIRLTHTRIRLNGLEPAKKAPIDEDGNAVPVQLNNVINVLNLIKKENPPAYKAFVKATANGMNGEIVVKPKQIKGGKKR